MKNVIRFLTEDLPAPVTVFFCNGVCMACMAAFLLFVGYILRHNDARTPLQFVAEPLFSTSPQEQLPPCPAEQENSAEDASE